MHSILQQVYPIVCNSFGQLNVWPFGLRLVRITSGFQFQTNATQMHWAIDDFHIYINAPPNIIVAFTTTTNTYPSLYFCKVWWITNVTWLYQHWPSKILLWWHSFQGNGVILKCGRGSDGKVSWWPFDMIGYSPISTLYCGELEVHSLELVYYTWMRVRMILSI